MSIKYVKKIRQENMSSKDDNQRRLLNTITKYDY